MCTILLVGLPLSLPTTICINQIYLRSRPRSAMMVSPTASPTMLVSPTLSYTLRSRPRSAMMVSPTASPTMLVSPTLELHPEVSPLLCHDGLAHSQFYDDGLAHTKLYLRSRPRSAMMVSPTASSMMMVSPSTWSTMMSLPSTVSPSFSYTPFSSCVTSFYIPPPLILLMLTPI